MSRKIVLGVVVGGSVAACAFVILVLVHKGPAAAGLWAGIVAALAGVVAAAAAVWVLMPEPGKVPLGPEPKLEDWWVDRPAQLSAVVKALVDGQPGTVGITTGLYGAGGFGKTTLAHMVCADRRVRRWFRGRVYLVTVGRDVREAAAVADKVNDVIKLVTGEEATFTDPQLAGRWLGSLLEAGPRRLLVLDDVWEEEQLAPFTEGGSKCARLVTTRVPGLLAGRGPVVLVDQMSLEQARALLTAGLPRMDEAVVVGLLTVTGRWPLLLRLVSQILANYAQVATADVSAQGAVLLEQLAAGGPIVVDELAGDKRKGLDVGQPDQRARAVRATIEASAGLLEGQDPDRFRELCVFAEDEVIPFALVARLWRATAGLDELRAAQVCKRLAQLALVSQASGAGGGVALHDVIRDYLRAELGPEQLAALAGTLLDVVAAGLPAVSPPDPAAGNAIRVVWWELGDDDRYMWDHLIEHLLDAGRPSETDAVAGDLRWVGARLERFGPAAPAADLAAAGTPRAARLREVLERSAHLLAPTEPPKAVVDVLCSRVAADPDWGPQVTALSEICQRPRLVNRGLLPDLADPALRRVLTGHGGPVSAVAAAPDGRWLAAGGKDETVRVWDPDSGQQLATLERRGGGVWAVAVAAGGRWLAAGGWDGVLIWDPATWQQLATLEHGGGVSVLAAAPDGRWLAAGGPDGTVRVWDPATWQQLATLEGSGSNGLFDLAPALAVAPGGRWLAVGGWDGTVRIWDPATWQQLATLERFSLAPVLAAAPDGHWLAAGGKDGTVRVWDPATWQQLATLERRFSAVSALAAAPDGRWLAVGGWDGTVRILDPATWQQLATLKGHGGRFSGGVSALAAAPDGRWLASGGGRAARVLIWDPATWQQLANLQGNVDGVRVLAVAPDGRWLAAGGDDGTVRIWDPATWPQRAALEAHGGALFGGVTKLAVAPDGRWLAIGGRDGMVRIWNPASGQQLATLKSHKNGVWVLAVAPDGRWLAAGGDDGTVRIWDPATWQQCAALEGYGGGQSGGVPVLAAAPDGHWLAAGGGEDGTVRIWDPATWQQLATLDHGGGVSALAVAPDGHWLAASGGRDGVRIWDPATWQQLATLDHGGRVSKLAAAPDGHWLAGVGQDGVRIWGPATWQQLATLERGGGVSKLAVAPDGRWLAAGGSEDGTVLIWDPATWQQLATLKGHKNRVSVLAAAPDGRWLAVVGSWDSTVRIWDPTTGHVGTLMRVDNLIHECVWLGSDALAVGGPAGLYLFDFLTETSTAAAGQ